MAREGRRLVFSVEKICHGVGSKIVIGSEHGPEGSYLSVCWRDDGAAATMMHYEMPVYDTVYLRDLLDLIDDLRVLDMSVASDSQEWVSPSDVVGLLVRHGAELDGPIPPVSIPDLGEELTDVGAFARCGFPSRCRCTERTCWGDGCQRLGCRGWWGMCCEHGREAANEERRKIIRSIGIDTLCAAIDDRARIEKSCLKYDFGKEI